MPTLVTRGAASVRGFGFAGTTPVLADPYFNYTTLLLHGNGTDGGQNNTFLDSGTANGGVGFDITRNGNTTQGTFSPFSQTGWSNYFDGSGDYCLTSSTQVIPTGSFTVEAWVYPLGTGNSAIVAQGTSGNSGRFSLGIESGLWFLQIGDSTVNTGTPASNQWIYVAATFNGSTLTLYVNGTSIGTVSTSNNAQNTTLRIGTLGPSDWANYYWNGYISNLRISNTVRTVTSIPTSPFTNDGNTTFLSCQSNRFVDNSTSPKTLTVYGNTSVQAFSPFAPTAAYSASTVGGSGYFDGSGDYLTGPSNAAFAFGTGDLTVEFWLYTLSTPGVVAGIYDVGTTNTSGRFVIDYYSDQKVKIETAGSTIVASSTNLPLNSWVHIAAVRSGTTMSLYQNGTRVGTATDSTNFSQNSPWVGQSLDGYAYNGYISSLRAVKGTPVYDPTQTSITVPTAPLTNITNTSLLLNFTNAAIIDNTAKNVLETVGNAQISTTQSKFGGASLAFDGTGDYLKYLGTVTAGFGSGNFTIEFWINAPSSNDKFILALRGGLSGGPHVTTGGYGGTTVGALRWASNAGEILSGTTVITDNTWHHCAIVRNGSTITLYVDGVSRGSGTDTTSFDGNGGQILIGENNAGGNTLTGYIDDLRITKGIARYTSNFTPQTSQWQDQ
jgi:hypothetical protein